MSGSHQDIPYQNIDYTALAALIVQTKTLFWNVLWCIMSYTWRQHINIFFVTAMRRSDSFSKKRSLWKVIISEYCVRVASVVLPRNQRIWLH